MAKVRRIDRRLVDLSESQLKTMRADPRVRGGGAVPRNASGGPGFGPAGPALNTHPPLPTTTLGKPAIALSGGAAKGSFQVGALKYLYEERHLHPRIIVGTSVGAVNGVKLAEGDKPSQTPNHLSGFRGLEKSWLDVVGPADMFKEQDAFTEVQKILKDPEGLIVDIVTTEFGKTLLGPLWYTGIGERIEEDNYSAERARKLFEDFFYIDGLITLNPVLKKLTSASYLDQALVENSKIDFRAVWVGMLSGEAYCVDSAKKLYRLAEPNKEIGSVMDLPQAVIASAAQPLFMQSPIIEGEIGGRKFKEKGFDGGVKEIVGVKSAAQMGATEVYAILCQPIMPAIASIFEQTESLDLPNGQTLHNFFHANTRRYKSILALAERGLSLALDEILDNDLALAGDANVTVIRPYIEVHDGFTLDPGLIRVNIAHGWMCAFDLFHDTGQPSFNFVTGGNRLITESRARKQWCLLLKKMLASFINIASLRPFIVKVMPKVESAIDDCNAKIKDGIWMRRLIDPASLPADADSWAS